MISLLRQMAEQGNLYLYQVRSSITQLRSNAGLFQFDCDLWLGLHLDAVDVVHGFESV